MKLEDIGILVDRLSVIYANVSYLFITVYLQHSQDVSE